MPRLPGGDIGLEMTRQYYLRVISARDGSPAAKAGLQTGDYVRAIDGKPTRDMSVFEGIAAAARRARVEGGRSRSSAATPRTRTKSRWCARSRRRRSCPGRLIAVTSTEHGTSDDVR